MNFSLGNIWYLLLLLLLPVIVWLLFGFKKWKSERRNVFAEAQFQEDLFPKNHQFSKFFPVLYLLAFVFLTALARSLEGYLPKTFIRFVSKYSYAAFLVHHIIISGTVSYSRNYLIALPQQIIMLSLLTCLIFLVAFMVYNSTRRLLPWFS